MKGLLITSKETKAPIMIYYMDKHNNVTQRIVTVKAISMTSIKAFCHMRKADRIFKVDNILSCGPIGKRNVS